VTGKRKRTSAGARCRESRLRIGHPDVRIFSLTWRQKPFFLQKANQNEDFL
jgi:hypothetical protein